MPNASTTPVLETIPSADQVRAQLSERLREVRLLKRLLKIAEESPHRPRGDRK